MLGNSRRSKVTTSPPPSLGPALTAHTPVVDVGGDRSAGAHAAAREAALQKSLRLYQTMFEHGSFGQLIVDFQSFRIEVVNTALCTMTGFSADELVNKDVAMIFPTDQSPIANTVERLADGATDGYSVERVLQRRDGTVLPILSTVYAVRDHDGTPVQLLVLMQDLTRQRAADGTQRRSQALIDVAVAALPVTFTTFDSDLRITSLAGGLTTFSPSMSRRSPRTRRHFWLSRRRWQAPSRRRARSSTVRPT